MNGLLYWRTIRYLKMEQILGRLSFVLKTTVETAHFTLRQTTRCS